MIFFTGEFCAKEAREMENIKVLIADATEEFPMALAERLRGEFHIRICNDGNQTLELLRSYQPDILVLDLMLSGLDGISVLQAAEEMGIHPEVLATTRFISSYVMEAMNRFGVGYLMVKPCDVSATLARIRDLSRKRNSPIQIAPDIRSTVSNILIRLGMPTKLRGYGCAREAILCQMRDPDMSVTKELYPEVAELCDGTTAQVERAIRGAIFAAWNVRDDVVWCRFFVPGKDGVIHRPTNAEFISRIADYLKLEEQENSLIIERDKMFMKV
jgi:two-component system response regulator (stage 0 sporulation protein A)